VEEQEEQKDQEIKMEKMEALVVVVQMSVVQEVLLAQQDKVTLAVMGKHQVLEAEAVLEQQGRVALEDFMELEETVEMVYKIILQAQTFITLVVAEGVDITVDLLEVEDKVEEQVLKDMVQMEVLAQTV
tara:strand:- start:63 stop:449 length:387 start_codon:yes stop_codon:yes gene_type:complete